MWPEILLSDCGKPYPRKRDLLPHCSTTQIEHTQGDSGGKIHVLGNESIDNCYRIKTVHMNMCVILNGYREREGCLNLQIQQHCEG